MSGLPYISPFYATSYDNLSYNKSTITQEGFKGTFDGKGHTISNMSVPYADGRYSAGIVGNNSGTIKNVIMDNFSYDNGGTYDGRYGAICGVNFGTVENCGVVNSLVRVDNKICGAMVGANYGGTINNSFAKGCTVTANSRAGYLVGDNCNDDSSLKGKIVNCYVDGNRLQGTQNGASCTGDSIISADRFKSGEICYKLNDKVNGGTTWYQVINSDEYPKLQKSGTTNTVYYGYEHCGSTSKTYSNSSRYTERPNHGSISVSGSYYTATYSNWSGTWDAPTCNFSLKCTKCSQQVITDAELTPSTTYDYGSLTETAKVDAKCSATGSRTLKAKGYYPGAAGFNSYTEASDKYTKTYTIPSLGHGTTGYTESYSWSGTCYNDATKDTKSCKFTLTCKKCSLNVVSGKYLTPTLKAHTDADCTNTGSTTYEVTGTYTAQNSTYDYSATKTNDYTVAALGHGSTGYTETYSWTGTCYNDATQDNPACTFTLTCKKCSEDVVSEESLTPTLKWHTDAGCLTTGNTTYQATGTYSATGSKDYSATKTHEYTVAAIGHNYVFTDGDNGFEHCKNQCGQLFYQPAEVVACDQDGHSTYSIGNAGQLYWFADKVNGGVTGINGRLTRDIVIPSGKNWTPIGCSFFDKLWINYSYSGTFDGQNHTISGLTCNSSRSTNNYYIGLFGTIQNATIKDVGLLDCTFTGTFYVGAICGEILDNSTKIYNCYATGSVSGSEYIGGLCGSFDGLIERSWFSGTVEGRFKNIGGLCGYTYGAIEDCWTDGTVKSTYICDDSVTPSDYSIGGIVGGSRSNIRNCYSRAILEISDSRIAHGSICGLAGKPVVNCYYEEQTGVNAIGVIPENSNGSVTNVVPKTAIQFASGEIAWKLNGTVDSNGTWTAGQTTGSQAWYQNLDTDDYPVLKAADGNTVYSMNSQYNNSGKIAVSLTQVGDKYYGVMYSDFPYSITDATAYIATGDADGIVTMSNANGEVAKETGVIIVGNAATATLTYNSSATSSKGVFKGSTSETTSADGRYVFGVKNGLIGLYKASKDIVAFKPYYEPEASSAKGMQLVFEDGTTTNLTPALSEGEGVEIYNLQGQKLNKPQKGVNIINGKKVMVR